ncbi:proline-rich receptor-like protein kinase PERK8 [Hevea brasiliensis]|uniref:proline-rich receptor-like protein kinase PERK8 n=1 Tax=Hevea brasiliensis TaxID=3981 RepID=UPI0025EBD01A|nr:proline-rich receptor-like protein kinase PERK8 [Hevea brasiliensis]
MEMPPPSPQSSPLQFTPLAMQAPNPDSPPQQTPPPPPISTYKRRIRSKLTRPMASAPPPAKRKDPPATPLFEPTLKHPRTSASTQQGVDASTSTPQTKSPSSSKKQPSAVVTQHPLPALSDTLYFDVTHLYKTGFSLPPSDTAQPVGDTGPSAQLEAQSAPVVQQPSAEPAPPTQSAQDTLAKSTQKLESGLDILKDHHDQLFNLVMETRDKQKELKEMMKQLMLFNILHRL